MAFVTIQTSSSGSGDIQDRLPILKYDGRSGRLFLIDRQQDTEGNWSSEETDVTMTQPAFAVDFGSLEVGWAYFAPKSAPQWATAPFGKQTPARPASPGNDDKGKPLNYKQGFKVKVIGKGIGGVREFGGNSQVLLGGMNELHTEFEAAPEAASGMIPLVKMVKSVPIKSAQSTNYQPVFAIQQWVARPDTLGARTVPPPSAGARTSQTHEPPNHVPPPPPKPAPEAEKVEEEALPF